MGGRPKTDKGPKRSHRELYPLEKHKGKTRGACDHGPTTDYFIGNHTVRHLCKFLNPYKLTHSFYPHRSEQ